MLAGRRTRYYNIPSAGLTSLRRLRPNDKVLALASVLSVLCKLIPVAKHPQEDEIVMSQEGQSGCCLYLRRFEIRST